MTTPSKMVWRFLVLLLLSIPVPMIGFAATYVPNSFTSMTGGATYCIGATPANVTFTYGTCNAGGGGPVGISCTIRWWYNTTASTNTVTATLVNTVVHNSGTAGAGNTFTQAPLTTTQGTFYYFAVVSWTGGGTCNASGVLAATTTTEVIVNSIPVAIAGNTSLCSGGLITQLSDNGSPSGTWSTSNTSAASVSATGSVMSGTAANVGTTTITYSDGCAPAASITFSVNATPVAIAGNTSLCSGGLITQLSDNGSPSGTWSTSNTSAASVSATGSVMSGTAANVGTTTITYSDGCAPATSITFSVNATPVAITGNTSLCSGGLITQLSDNGSPSGTWSTSNTSAASVSATGSVMSGTAANVGTTTITYSDGCAPAASITFSVNATPVAIAGNTSLCSGGLITQLSDNGSPSGTWSTSNTSAASVSATGSVMSGTAANVGTTTITYSDGCAPAASITFSVNATPVAIAGNTSLCSGGLITQLSDNGSPSGTWSGGTAGIATVGPATGIVTPGATAGSTTISYSDGCGIASATVTVGAPNAGSISGPAGVCTSSIITLSDGVPGGAWSSSNTGVATVDASGNVTGITPGTTVISYSVTNSCGPATATYTVTAAVAASAGTIDGPTSMCAGSFTVLTDAVSGGVWSAGNADATITPTGLLTAVTPGVDIISYTVTNACGPTSATLSVTIGPYLDPGTISGPSSVCPGSNITLSDDVSGGVWSSTNTSAATISGVGVVYGVSAGATTISYLIISGCGSVAATYNITVNPSPAPGFITGPTVICSGSFAMLSDSSPGGVWSTSNTNIATITNTGTVSGASAGSVTVSYTATNVCGSLSATFPMTISLPPNAGTITGPSSVCAGSNISLTDAASGGVWNSGNANASVSATGVVSGLTAGAGIISYTSTTACGSQSATYPITVNPLPVPGSITGPSTVCTGFSILISDVVPGGVWSSSNTSVATVSASASVTAVSSGAATISYSVTNICGTAAAMLSLTVNSSPVVAAITGAANVCVGGSVTLSDATSGGLWSSSNTNISIMSGASGLVVTGVSAGTAVVSYALTNLLGCTVTQTVTENINGLPAVAAISGTGFGCVGIAAALSDATSGGVWSSSNSAIATIDPASGIQTGVANGMVTIAYAVTNISGCTNTVTMAETIQTAPVPTVTTGVTTICDGSATSLSNAVSGGVWSSATSVATVTAAGNVTGLAAGTDYIIYTVTNACGTVMDSALVTVNPTPVVNPISAANTVICAGLTTALSESITGGAWSSGNTAVAVVSGSGVVTGVSAGIAAISYSATNGSGCSAAAIILISVGPALPAVTVLLGASATLCHANPVALTASSSGGSVTYQWSIGSTPIPGATDSVYLANMAGTYSVMINNGTCSETLAGTVVIVAPDPVIGFTAPDVLYTGSFSTYQWFLNGVLIPGATASVLNETGNGAYTVVVTDGNGCSDTSAVYTVGTTTGVNTVTATGDIKIYPNPANAVLHIDAPVQVNVSILSVDGKVVMIQKDAANIDVSALANGMYLIMIYDQDNNFIKSAKFAKTE